MQAILFDTLRRSRGQIIGWGMALFLLGLMIVVMYDSMASEFDKFLELADAYPPEIMAFFGDISQINTPEGFLSIEFFSFMPVLLGIFALLYGSSLILKEESRGTLDLLLSYPITRSELFWGRVGGYIATLTSILFLGWLGLCLPLLWSNLELTPLQVAKPFLSLFAQVFLIGNIALVLSMFFPNQKIAAMISAFYLIFGFFVKGFAEINKDFLPLAKLSSLYYYQSGDAINTLNWGWIMWPILLSFLLCLVAWKNFQQRDIKVIGEGSFQFPFFKSITKPTLQNPSK